MPALIATAPRRILLVGLLGVLVAAGAVVALSRGPAPTPEPTDLPPAEVAEPTDVAAPAVAPPRLAYKPRKPVDVGGFGMVSTLAQTWKVGASLEEIAAVWRGIARRGLERFDQRLTGLGDRDPEKVMTLLAQASLFNSEGEPERAAAVLTAARALAERHDELAADWLYTVVYVQGVTALRRGENENCIQCRGESSCILPIASAAVHINPGGSRQAIHHFSEYLRVFPDDLEVRWLLNLAHMTLGEHPHRVAPAWRVSLDRWRATEFDLGRFRDVGHLVGVNRLNMAGGAIMDDFDNDGRLDVVVSCMDPLMPMAYYRNRGDGTFEDRTAAAGLGGQLGGLYCVQGDYNNDGHLDVFVARGAWLTRPMPPSLLRNNGDGTFTDVTAAAGVDYLRNSITAAWADYDNDGHLDLFFACEAQPNCLFRNRGDGTFEEVALKAGLQGSGKTCKGNAWLDYDNDGFPDLFLNYLGGTAEFYRNNRDGTFTEATAAVGIDGPRVGFSCWAWDYDNDGWLDVYATSYAHSVEGVVQGLTGQPHALDTGRLYRNLQGKGFEDLTKSAGVDQVYAAMGSNVADFDNDGYLDFYLATGDPSLATLVPNRMFKNVGGRRFAEITASAGVGHLQKGHAVACGDWDRDGDLDMFAETGGPIHGDRYHNVLYQNPGQGNHWLSVKLVGQKTNRAAIGARIKVVTAGPNPLTVHRHVNSGSSFGANALEQHIGLGKADKVALVEIHWPTSGTTQTFRDLPADRAIEITEFAKEYRLRTHTPIALPKAD